NLPDQFVSASATSFGLSTNGADAVEGSFSRLLSSESPNCDCKRPRESTSRPGNRGVERHAGQGRASYRAVFGDFDCCVVNEGVSGIESGEMTVSLSRSRLGRLSGLVPVLFACDSARG